MVTHMANPTNFRLTPFAGLTENTQLNFSKLYLRQIYSLPNTDPNQSVIISGSPDSQFGLTAVNNRAICDGSSLDAPVLAHVEGLHMNAGDWYISFTMLFDGESSYKGSTLQIMGATLQKSGDWSIVGGTGMFEMARGVIKRKLYEQLDGAEIYEIAITCCCATQSFPEPIMNGPWGRRNAGTACELEEMPWRLESVTITYYGLINALSYTYTDQHGKTQTVGPWGSGWTRDRSQTKTMTLAPSEYLREVSGEFEPDTSNMQSITFVSNIRTYGPFGALDRSNYPEGTLFKFSVDDVAKSCIVGFYATTDDHIRSFGVYTV